MTARTALSSDMPTADATLRARAQRVVPGGMWGHLNAARLPEGRSGEGCAVVLPALVVRRAPAARVDLPGAVAHGAGTFWHSCILPQVSASSRTPSSIPKGITPLPFLPGCGR